MYKFNLNFHFRLPDMTTTTMHSHLNEHFVYIKVIVFKFLFKNRMLITNTNFRGIFGWHNGGWPDRQWWTWWIILWIWDRKRGRGARFSRRNTLTKE